MPPDPSEVAAWLVKASRDLSAARKLFTPDCTELEAVGFHCQQAVEKTLKAFLISRGAPFEKLHDLRYLSVLCAGIDLRFAALNETVAPLTAFAVSLRYPGPAEPSRDDIQRALSVTETVVAQVAEWMQPPPDQQP